MKRKIEQLLNGRFEYEKASLVLLPEALTIPVTQGGRTRGSFWMESPDDRKVRGFLYSSNPRILCEPSEFNSARIEVRYQADGSGFPQESEEEGFITICSNIGEYRLPFRLISDRVIPKQEEQLPFERPEELADVARQDYQKAYRCFLQKEYRALLETHMPELTGLYDALMEGSRSYQTMEEFLTGASWKDRVEIRMEVPDLSLGDVLEMTGEKIQITKNVWGFQKIELHSDAEFVRPEKTLLTTDEFAGSTYELNLVVDPMRMHAGRNFARVTVSTPYQTFTIKADAHKGVSDPEDLSVRTCRQMQKKLEQLYIAFRLKKMEMPQWIEKSCNVIDTYRSSGGNDVFAELFLIQLYFADGKRQKAIRLLEEVEAHRERLKSPEQFGFYLYLSTFFYQEADYVNRVEEEIRLMLYRNPSCWVLQWILLYLQDSLAQNDGARYEAVAEQFQKGCRSRIMYQEAFQILQKDPFQMRHLGSFELQLLRFGAKEDVLSVEMIRQTANLASHYGKYSRLLLEILEEGYKKHPASDLLKAVCRILMLGERRDIEAFYWYQKGVDAGVRITGLYEFYMESSPDSDLMRMPQIIRMYFVYDTTIDYRKRAAIYRCILDRKEEDVQTYRTYRAAMEKFASDQLDMGRLTDDLAVLYRSFLRKKLLTRQMAEQLARLLFTYEVTCDSPDIRSITVYSERLLQQQTALLAEGKAQIAIYDPDSILIAENDAGERICGEGLLHRRKVFESSEMLDWCIQLAPEFFGILLFVCAGCADEKIATANSIQYLVRGCEREEFSGSFRDRLRAMVLQYYADHPRDEGLPDFLEQIRLEDYAKVDKSALITLLAEEGRCKEAFELLDQYGVEGIPLIQLVRISSRMVLELEFAENPMLISMCWICFSSEKFNDKILRYLLLYFEGSILEMESVWDAARRFDLDTMMLEEKILMMILFTGSRTEGSEQIFEAYEAKMGRKKICRAYTNLKAYEYFVKGIPAADCVFRSIEKDYAALYEQQHFEEQEVVCRLALLQYYSGQVRLGDLQREFAASLLEEFNVKGMRFAFWKKFDRDLIAPYQLEGRVFVEYAGNPESSVILYWRKKDSGGEYRNAAMKNCFEGIFVREFTLFYGDELECWIEEERKGQKKRTDQRILSWPKSEEAESSQYEMINQISKARLEQNEEALETELDNYLLQQYLAKEIFTLI